MRFKQTKNIYDSMTCGGENIIEINVQITFVFVFCALRRVGLPLVKLSLMNFILYILIYHSCTYFIDIEWLKILKIL